MIEAYLQRLEAELAERGVRGRAANRVLTEARDHLLELEEKHVALEAFGPTDRVAREIAAQLATTRTLRATYGAFVALAFSGLGYLGFVAYTDHGGSPDIFSGRHEAIGVLAVLGLLVFPQVAFVSGSLALLRALRLRGQGSLPAEELAVLRARSFVALAAGGLTLAAMIAWVVEFHGAAPLLGLCLALAVPLLVIATVLASSRRSHAVIGAGAGDLFDDLGLERFRVHPWHFALLVATVAAIPAFVAGGPILAAVESLAVLSGFALLGRRLALHR